MHPCPNTFYSAKHYYAGAERLCTKLGNGGLGDEYIGVDPELTDRANQLFDQVMADASTRSLGNNDFVIADIEGSESGFNVAFDPSQAPQHVNSDITIDLDPFFATMESLSASDGSREDELYFFHSDHLGSGSWITNGTGAPVQHLQYLAYGDKFVDHKASTSSYTERFTFTGKERDAETGFTYHGARYFDAALLTSWMAVDPMSDKYPSLSPYNYCAWNPVKLVDPDGNSAEIPPEVKRFGHGLAQFAGGILTIGGGLTIGVLGSETAVLPVVGFALIADGGYSMVQGLHQMTNVLAGQPASEDPQYSTVAGEVSDNKTVDNVVSGIEAVVGNGANSIVKASTKKAATETASKAPVKSSTGNAQRNANTKKTDHGTAASHSVTGLSTGVGHHRQSTNNKPSPSNGQSNTSNNNKPHNCKELINP